MPDHSTPHVLRHCPDPDSSEADSRLEFQWSDSMDRDHYWVTGPAGAVSLVLVQVQAEAGVRLIDAWPIQGPETNSMLPPLAEHDGEYWIALDLVFHAPSDDPRDAGCGLVETGRCTLRVHAGDAAPVLVEWLASGKDPSWLRGRLDALYREYAARG
jgi:hypothetical protein